MENESPKPVVKRTAPKSVVKKKTAPQISAAKMQQIGLNLVMVGVVALAAYFAYLRLTGQPIINRAQRALPEVVIDPQPTPESGAQVAALSPEYFAPISDDSLARKTNLKTIIPSRARVNVITYTVTTGDSLFSIAYNYGLKPESLLFGNYDVLQDNPHLLKPKQVLNILPVDGAFYKWKEGDTLGRVASEFKVEPQAIIDYTGNFIDLTAVENGEPKIEPGSWLIIPGGKRAIKDWGPPAITRSNPAVARYYGEGACGVVTSGAMGTGGFVWPTTDRTISGYTFDSNVHPGVDIGGQEGNAIFASDSGVVVYAGWSNFGYGYMIVIDHGNGWQSAYAHLSAVAVSCGQSVFQGGYIGALGNTGNSSGAHLHFELSIGGAKVNPVDYAR